QISDVNSTNNIKEEPLELKDESIDNVKRGDPFGNENRRKCVVCHRMCSQTEMHCFTKNLTKQTAWVNAVRSTPEGRNALMEQLNSMMHPYLCESHFSPSDFTHNAKGTGLKSDAVPFFEVNTSIPPAKHSNIMEIEGKQQTGHIHAQECFLCGEFAFPYLITPKDSITACLFFNNLIELNSDQLKKVQQLMKFNTRALICRKHYRESTSQADNSQIITHKSSSALKKKRSRTELVPIDLDHSDYGNINEEPFDEPSTSR
ncbi:hypothetical protein PMAYCL1PPCAC_01504, partial [Pristionchus mayeri]